MSPPPREAYIPPKGKRLIKKEALLDYLNTQVSGTTDPRTNAAYLLIMHGIEKGMFDA